MKKIIISLVLASIACVAGAQNNNVRRLEFELGFGFNKGATINGGKAAIGGNMFIEARNNIVGTPFDIGFQAMIGSFDRAEDSMGRERKNRFELSPLIFADYNFRKWKNIAPFAGLGFGYASIEETITSWGPNDPEINWLNRIKHSGSFIFNPRVGVEFFNHLRVTLEYKLMRPQYSYFGISIGGVLGGGQKK